MAGFVERIMDMKLVIDNISKIRHAEFEFRGITVIAGNNNTGKSTVGKVMFSAFNSLRNIGEKVERQRQQQKMITLIRALSNSESVNDDNIWMFLDLIKSIEGKDIQIWNFSNKRNFAESLKKFLKKSGIKHIHLTEDLISVIWEKIGSVDKIADSDVQGMLIERVFKNIFDKQINSITDDNKAKIELTIQKKKIGIEFANNQCINVSIPIQLIHKAILLQTPDSIHAFNNLDKRYRVYQHHIGLPEAYLIDFMKHAENQTVIDEVENRKKLEDIYMLIHDVVPGQFTQNENGEFVYRETGYKEGLHLINLSTGSKSFGMLSLILNHNVFTDEDVLILDEPEVHLHPEWQLKYAQMVILLQKVFHLTILLTTHSPYFLEAVEVYARKYGVDGITNYYMARNQGNYAEFEEVTDDIDKIYQEMSEPFEHLDDLRLEMEMDKQ